MKIIIQAINNANSKLIILLTIVGLCSVDCRLLYAQAAKLRVRGDVSCESIILGQQEIGAFPCDASHEGWVVNSSNQLYYCDGTDWRIFGGGAGDRTIAPRIVAAYNSLGSTVDGSAPEYDGEGNCTNCCVSDGNPCINPKADTGYTCTGINDQQKIDTAITDFPQPSGGAVYLLEGTYNISSPIVLDNNISLIGSGAATILKASGSINVIDSLPGQIGLLISQLTIDGNNIANYGINFDTVTNSRINQVQIQNPVDKGILIFAGGYNTISDVTITGGSTNRGIELLSSSNNIVSHNQIQTKDGICLLAFGSSSHRNLVLGNSIYASLIGINIKDGSNNNIVSGNYIEKSGTDTNYGITIESYSSNNKISNNRLNKTGIKLFQASDFNIVSNNNISQSNQHGIYIGSSKNVISKNIISASGDGIRIKDDGSDFIAMHNLISSNLIDYPSVSNYGIYIASSTDVKTAYNYLAGNLIKGATENRIYNPGEARSSLTDTAMISFDVNLGLYLDPAVYQPIPTNWSYVPLKLSAASGTNKLPAGKYPGDILILHNTTNVYMGGCTNCTYGLGTGGNMKLRYDTAKTLDVYHRYTLSKFDIISFIWDGSYWVETGLCNWSGYN